MNCEIDVVGGNALVTKEEKKEEVTKGDNLILLGDSMYPGGSVDSVVALGNAVSGSCKVPILTGKGLEESTKILNQLGSGLGCCELYFCGNAGRFCDTTFSGFSLSDNLFAAQVNNYQVQANFYCDLERNIAPETITCSTVNFAYYSRRSTSAKSLVCGGNLVGMRIEEVSNTVTESMGLRLESLNLSLGSGEDPSAYEKFRRRDFWSAVTALRSEMQKENRYLSFMMESLGEVLYESDFVPSFRMRRDLFIKKRKMKKEFGNYDISNFKPDHPRDANCPSPQDIWSDCYGRVLNPTPAFSNPETLDRHPTLGHPHLCEEVKGLSISEVMWSRPDRKRGKRVKEEECGNFARFCGFEPPVQELNFARSYPDKFAKLKKNWETEQEKKKHLLEDGKKKGKKSSSSLDYAFTSTPAASPLITDLGKFHLHRCKSCEGYYSHEHGFKYHDHGQREGQCPFSGCTLFNNGALSGVDGTSIPLESKHVIELDQLWLSSDGLKYFNLDFSDAMKARFANEDDGEEEGEKFLLGEEEKEDYVEDELASDGPVDEKIPFKIPSWPLKYQRRGFEVIWDKPR